MKLVNQPAQVFCQQWGNIVKLLRIELDWLLHFGQDLSNCANLPTGNGVAMWMLWSACGFSEEDLLHEWLRLVTVCTWHRIVCTDCPTILALHCWCDYLAGTGGACQGAPCCCSDGINRVVFFHRHYIAIWLDAVAWICMVEQQYAKWFSWMQSWRTTHACKLRQGLSVHLYNNVWFIKI